MNFAPYQRLLWKEYRAVRLFWLSLVALCVFIEWLAVALSPNIGEALIPIFGLALGAPVFFALGCAGTAFAIEQEDGTYDFLQSIPATARQVLVSKLALIVAATVAMYLALVAAALYLAHGALPDAASAQRLAAVWVVAAFEAIAWGTFFSLLTSRPLLAITLAAVVGGGVIHSLARQIAPTYYESALEQYFRTAPWRMVIAAVVCTADIYLGLRWLHRPMGIRRKAKRQPVAEVPLAIPQAADVAPELLLKKPERATELARLFWQHWRQSGRVMLLMAALCVGLSLLWQVTLATRDAPTSSGAEVPMVALSALMGAFVFRADQEGHRFRFFVEHNVPPRFVWLSRQLAWLVVLLVSIAIIYVLRFAMIWYAIASLRTDVESIFREHSFFLTQVGVGLACVAVSYSIGQWCSMFIRSGLLAGSVAILLAVLLCFWVGLMYWLQISWLWSVAPIPLVLVFATWLRAPDWIRENTAWRARLRASAVVLVPMGALLVAVPMYRVYSVPLVSAGFDLAKYQARITPAVKKTAEEFRRIANRLVSSDTPSWADSMQPLFRPMGFTGSITPGQKEWLDQNKELIPEIMKLSERPAPAIDDPATLRRFDARPYSLIWLLVLSARQLEADGKLDEALDRYFAALRLSSILSSSMPALNLAIAQSEASIIRELSFWAAQRGQTAARVQGALARLKKISPDILHIDNALKSEYILERRQLLGDEDALFIRYGGSEKADAVIFREILWGKLLPWEKYRRLRELNLLSYEGLGSLERMRNDLDEGRGVAGQIPDLSYQPSRDPRWIVQNQWKMDYHLSFANAAFSLAYFEAVRRGTMLVLAFEAYRLEHGKLPPAQSDLIGWYFDALPLDPFCGCDFAYFPDGLPKPKAPTEDAELERAISNGFPGGLNGDAEKAKRLLFSPGLWCSSPNMRLNKEVWTYPEWKEVWYYVDGRRRENLAPYVAWGRGYWFAIPDQER